MPKIKIIKYPNLILTTPCKEVESINGHTETLINNLHRATLQNKERRGFGMAANQIGVDARIFATKINGKKRHFINPKYATHRGSVISEEGCFSFNKLITYKIKRYEIVTIQYSTLTEEKVMHGFEGFEALVIQHEMDHLNGITIYDRWKGIVK